MVQTFWERLAKPIIALSPTDGVSDYPFRAIQKKYGQPTVMYTEFTSVEGVCHGADRLLKDFLFDELQRPIIGQIYGTTPAFFQETATVLCELGFDGIDINMGCPAKTVSQLGAGAALIRTPKLAQDIVAATKKGIEEYQNGKRARECEHITEEIWQEVERRQQALPEAHSDRSRIIPVSVKTRVGFDQIVTKDWISTLLETQPAAIALHGRTLKQAYGGEANWEEIGTAAALTKQTSTLLLGNGDVHSYTQALEKVAQYEVDGVLIARASFGNPFVFLPPEKIPVKSLFEIALEHSQLYEKTYNHDPRYTFMPMRKHLGWYVKEIPGARQIRIDLFKTNSSEEVAQVLQANHLI